MKIEHGISQTNWVISEWRKHGLSVALVPTMGNLHRGHLMLVREAMELADRVVVSVFVNPVQFCEGEDFDAYPRTLERDRDLLANLGAHLLFAPSAEELYPLGGARTLVDQPGLADDLCGRTRPGHFRGVLTVISKLFNIIRPDYALFGEKDYQQLSIIRTMVADLNFPVNIVGMPTTREDDGLAMSSRNQYLSTEERQLAPELYRCLREAGGQLLAEGGLEGVTEIESLARDRLVASGFVPDYFAIRDANTLGVPDGNSTSLVILAAARLGSTRLIDNLRVERELP